MRFQLPQNRHSVFELPQALMAKWNNKLRAALTGDNVVNIYLPIGQSDWFSDAFGVADLQSFLDTQPDNGDIVVNINSPGGDVFEGVGIYELLRDWSGEVTVNIIGLAASAASFIAMAGDTINISAAGFIMIHEAWTIAAGNKGDMTATAGLLAQTDGAIAGIYQQHTGISAADISNMMNAETWLNADAAIKQGFADQVLNDASISTDDNDNNASALRRIDTGLAKGGMSRAERRELIAALTHPQEKGTPGAADPSKPRATGNKASESGLNLQFGSLAAALRS